MGFETEVAIILISEAETRLAVRAKTDPGKALYAKTSVVYRGL